MSGALREHGFVPVACRVLEAAAPVDAAPLERAAHGLTAYDWVICASARAVSALVDARRAPWPVGLRTAAVGRATAQALRDAGAVPEPVTAPEGGADPLWPVLAHADTWPGRRVLLPTTPGGRRVLAEQLTAAGAEVHEVEAYRMVERRGADIARDWRDTAPDAVVLTSPRIAQVLAAAVGTPALEAVRAVVAIGTTTAATLRVLGLASTVAGATTFASAAAALAARRDSEVRA